MVHWLCLDNMYFVSNTSFSKNRVSSIPVNFHTFRSLQMDPPSSAREMTTKNCELRIFLYSKEPFGHSELCHHFPCHIQVLYPVPPPNTRATYCLVQDLLNLNQNPCPPTYFPTLTTQRCYDLRSPLLPVALLFRSSRITRSE